MSKSVLVKEKCVFVNFQISPVAIEYKNELHTHLLDGVWADWCEAEEDICLVSDDESSKNLNIIRYQFPSVEVAAERMDRVFYLIQDQMDQWALLGSQKVTN